MLTRTFPTLFQKTATGAIQQWSITAHSFTEHEDAYEIGMIRTVFGQVGGKFQETTDLIHEGKNLGKKNETTAVEQAEKEAEAKWLKQKKKGYVESIEAAEAGGVDAVITGGIEPMLAQSYSKHAEKIKFPAYAQPKLDGIRCIAIVENGKCTLWSRTRKPITGVPHIARELEQRFGASPGRLVLDGELYNHALKKDFEKIVSMVRQEEPAPGHEIVQYHVYDIVIENAMFGYRILQLCDLGLPSSENAEARVVQVTTPLVQNEDDLMLCFDAYTKAGYEGCMARNSHGKYEIGKRSYHLQKIKDFVDAEFEILGVEEGRGKLQGHVAAFVCNLGDGRTFKAKPMGELGLLKSYFEDHSLWQGKALTVKYQNLTKDGIPRFPIGKTVRDYE